MKVYVCDDGLDGRLIGIAGDFRSAIELLEVCGYIGDDKPANYDEINEQEKTFVEYLGPDWKDQLIKGGLKFWDKLMLNSEITITEEEVFTVSN